MEGIWNSTWLLRATVKSSTQYCFTLTLLEIPGDNIWNSMRESTRMGVRKDANRARARSAGSKDAHAYRAATSFRISHSGFSIVQLPASFVQV